jgi:hypothetical protein
MEFFGFGVSEFFNSIGGEADVRATQKPPKTGSAFGQKRTVDWLDNETNNRLLAA